MILNQFKVTISLTDKKANIDDKALEDLSSKISFALDEIMFTQIIKQKFRDRQIDLSKIHIEAAPLDL